MGAREPPPGRRDEEFHQTLRPRDFGEYVGQTAVLEQLEISVGAARGRGEALDHVLLHGPPGLGKTSLAAVLARELDVPMHTSAGPLVPRTGDMVAL
ncbi:MAG: AAA family ATPase, partial [Acidobacteriota bacterium]|nr:AAA family ATPase [Acidobacteriota bacterium]